MQPIPVMVNGIPGNVACTVARHVQGDRRFRLIPCSFTGPEIQERGAPDRRYSDPPHSA